MGALLLALAAASGAAMTAAAQASPPAERVEDAAAPVESAGDRRVEVAAVPGSATSLVEALDGEISRAERHVQALEAFAAEVRAAREAQRERLAATGARVAELASELRIRAGGSAQASELYAQIVEELQRARPALREALDEERGPVTVPPFEPRFDPAGLEAPVVEDRLRRLRELRRDIDGRRTTLIADERELRWAAVEGWGSVTERLNDLRIAAIENLPAAQRRQVLGVSRDGVAQLGREIEQLRLSARLYRARQLNELERLPGRLHDIFTVGAATWTVVKILAALALFFFVRRHGSRIRQMALRFVAQAAATPSGRGRGETLVGLMEVLAPWSFFLALIAVLRWVLGPLAAMPRLDVPLRIAALYGVYRLAIDVLFAGAMRTARRYRLTLDEERTAEVLRSVRRMMRVVVGILVLLLLSERFVGRGYLYHLVERFAWIFVLGTGLLLLARWRRVIADAYVGLGGGGRLAALVRRSRDHWYGVFVSAAAFVLLAGRALLRIGRDFAMGFDQTRRALAFMFRRRVEKRAEERGYAEGDVDKLPPAVIAAFAELPVSEGTPAIGHYPGLDRLQAMVGPWLADEVGASFLLTGEKGMGKTSWLNRIEAGAVPIERITLTHRVLSESLLAGTLSKPLELPLVGDGRLTAVRKALLAGPKRIIAIDLGQNLFLSKVGGYDTFEEFVSLVEATCGQVFWVCSISAFAWDHLAAVRPDLMVFRDRQALTAWSEEQIGEMLHARTTAAGIDVVYDDLLFETQQSRDLARRLETAQQYTRLLWDYSDGNPRVALHYWLRSLVPDSERRLRVRLFRAPASGDLAGLSERSRFLLAALVVHENLSLREAAIVTRYPDAVCRLQFERLLDDGILRRSHGRYRLTTHWHRAVVRFLKRGNLLSD